MKLTLTTCALGALGLTPALMGTQQEAPAAPSAPSSPATLGRTVRSAPAGVWIKSAVEPATPGAPAALNPWVAIQQDDKDLQKAASDLERQVAELQKELKKMRASIKKEEKQKEKLERAQTKRTRNLGKEEALVLSRRLSKEASRSAVEQERAKLEGRIVEYFATQDRDADARSRKHVEKVREETRARAEELRNRISEMRGVDEEAREHGREARQAGEQARESGREVRAEAAEARERGREVREEAREYRGLVLKATGEGERRANIRIHEVHAEDGDKHIESHGPSTFNIHLEDGDVHIHAHGPSNFNTDSGDSSAKAKVKVKRFFQGGSKDMDDLFGNVTRKKTFTFDSDAFGSNAAPGESNNIRFFAKVDSDDEDENEFELEINGESIDFEDISELITEGIGASNIRAGVLSGVGGALEHLHGLENLHGLEVLEGLQGLEGLEGLLEGLEDMDDLEGALEGLKGFQGAFRINLDEGDFDFDFDMDDECDEEEEVIEEREQEEPIIEEEEVDDRNRVVRAPFIVYPNPQRSPRLGFPTPVNVNNRLVSGFPRSPEAELLELTREIQAEVRAMRQELNELRQEVTAAPAKPEILQRNIFGNPTNQSQW